MIVTLTLNPAVDKIIQVNRLAIGEVNRVRNSQLDAGGKGINVSRMVDRLGWPTIAFGFLAGEMGSVIERALTDQGVQYSFLRVAGQTRLNVTIFDQKSSLGSSFYERGPRVGKRQLEALARELQPWLMACRVLALGGSLIPGAPDSIYADYIQRARDAGIKTILDAGAESLRLGVAARPTLIKPNIEEAEQLVGHPLPDVSAVVEAARSIATNGVETVVISMAEQGAIMAHGAEAWRAIPPNGAKISLMSVAVRAGAGARHLVILSGVGRATDASAP
ncbi:MAG: 1-phosphofructokinase family hexose kinase, partial [Chloroflexota bacterium]